MAQFNYCPSCGSKLDKDYALCPNCGEHLRDFDSKTGPAEKKRTTKSQTKPVDYRLSGMESFLWGLLGFVVPVVGLIIYLVWRHEKPEIAGAIGTGALIGVVVAFLFVMFVVTVAGLQMTMMFQ